MTLIVTLVAPRGILASVDHRITELPSGRLFFAGAFLGARPWAVEIRNFEAPTPLSRGGIGPEFKTVAAEITANPMLLVGGSGRSAIGDEDRELLDRLVTRRPKTPEDYMQLLADVNSRAAQSRMPGAWAVSRACTVVFVPPVGPSRGRVQWYGPPGERPKWSAVSHVYQGIDIGEMVTAVQLQYESAFEKRTL